MSIPQWFASKRILVSRLLVSAGVSSLIFTQHSWREGGAIDISCVVVGYIMVVTATFLRLWCSIYIYGYKGHSLVVQGPYSVVRNPLYIASFIGAFGLGLISENVILLGVLAFCFLIYYPFVVINEERELEAELGSIYTDYKARVPRFIPKFSLFVEPENYEIYPRRVRQAFLDAMWFLWAIVGLEVLEFLRINHILPILFYIP